MNSVDCAYEQGAVTVDKDFYVCGEWREKRFIQESALQESRFKLTDKRIYIGKIYWPDYGGRALLFLGFDLLSTEGRPAAISSSSRCFCFFEKESVLK